jgi:4'-phosphopantetheinyl transferase
MGRRSPRTAAPRGTPVRWRTAIYPRGPGTPRLDPDELHLWSARLCPPASVEQRLRQSLDDDERARATRFMMAHDRTRFVVAHGLLRHVLGRYLRVAPELIQYRYANRGKPSLVLPRGAPRLQFNLSHSEDLALFAIVLRRSVGVDVERVQPGRDTAGISARFFSPSEAAAMRALGPDAQVEAFYNGWTRKEAYIKARGEGLSLPLDSFDVSLTPGEPAALLRAAGGRREVRRWELVGLTPAPGYAAAVAVEAGIRRIVGWTLALAPHESRVEGGDSNDGPAGAGRAE